MGSEQIGAGLGLSVVRAISSRIGADIRFGFSDEAKQAGPSVTIFFPATAALSGAAEVRWHKMYFQKVIECTNSKKRHKPSARC